MKSFLMFVAKVVVLAIVVLFLMFIGASIYKNNLCPICPVQPKVTEVTQGEFALSRTGVEKVCKFADGFDSEGKVVPSGTTVHGPAAIKPDRNRDHAILVLPGSNYVTSATDEVIWLYIGDNACVLAQGTFFSTIEIK